MVETKPGARNDPVTTVTASRREGTMTSVLLEDGHPVFRNGACGRFGGELRSKRSGAPVTGGRDGGGGPSDGRDPSGPYVS